MNSGMGWSSERDPCADRHYPAITPGSLGRWKSGGECAGFGNQSFGAKSPTVRRRYEARVIGPGDHPTTMCSDGARLR